MDSTENETPARNDGVPDLERFEYRDFWVTFTSFSDLTRNDMKELRKVVGSSKNDGEVTHNVMDRALFILIDGWNVTDKLGNELTLPKHCQGRTLDKISFEMGSLLETHIRPLLKMMRGKPEDEESKS